jgi:hypothetical protein
MVDGGAKFLESNLPIQMPLEDSLRIFTKFQIFQAQIRNGTPIGVLAGRGPVRLLRVSLSRTVTSCAVNILA